MKLDLKRRYAFLQITMGSLLGLSVSLGIAASNERSLEKAAGWIEMVVALSQDRDMSSDDALVGAASQFFTAVKKRASTDTDLFLDLRAADRGDFDTEIAYNRPNPKNGMRARVNIRRVGRTFVSPCMMSEEIQAVLGAGIEWHSEIPSPQKPYSSNNPEYEWHLKQVIRSREFFLTYQRSPILKKRVTFLFGLTACASSVLIQDF